MKEFDIKTSAIRLPTIKSKRKDGKISYYLYFDISGDKLNLYKFSKTFKLRYAFRKQKVFDKAIKKIKKNLERSLKQTDYCTKALILHKSGLGSRRIAKLFNANVPQSTIDSWLNTNRKPYYFRQKGEVEKLLKY